MPVAIAPVVTLSVFAIQAVARGTDSLSTAQAFTSLALITLITSPASQLISAVSSCAAGLGCLSRIQRYLLASVHDDRRQSRTVTGSHHLLNYTSNRSLELRPINKNRHVDHSTFALQVRQAYIRPSKDASFIVRDLNMEVKPGTLTIIAGPIGSGKSTIMKAILGEILCESGNVNIVSSNLAYCAQSPWLRNTRIQQSISELADDCALDEAWYNTVVYSCALNQDMEQFPDGDRTMIGSQGSMLSGGQRMRITLARALYSKPNIVLLDDVLSALDETTGDLVMQRLFSPHGIFRKLGTTIVLVTHTSMCQSPLSVLDFAANCC